MTSPCNPHIASEDTTLTVKNIIGLPQTPKAPLYETLPKERKSLLSSGSQGHDSRPALPYGNPVKSVVDC